MEVFETTAWCSGHAGHEETRGRSPAQAVAGETGTVAPSWGCVFESPSRSGGEGPFAVRPADQHSNWAPNQQDEVSRR